MAENRWVHDYVRSLAPYVPGKPVSELQRELGLDSIVKLASNENGYGPSPAVAEAIRGALGELFIYPDPSSYSLVGALSEHLDVERDRIVLGNGSDELITLLLRATCSAGDTIATVDGGFLMYAVFAKALGIRVASAPARNRYWYDLEALAETVNESGARVVFVANPWNPTGTWVGADALDRFLGAISDEVTVVLDEAYYEYVTAPEYPDGLQLASTRPRTLVMRTFSKAYGLAALRVGYGVTSPDLADYLNRLRAPFHINHLAQVAARAALADRDHLDRVRAFNAAGKAEVGAALDEMGLEYPESQANFYLFDLKEPGQAIYEKLLHRGVIARPTDRYGFDTHLRVTFGHPDENAKFAEALRAVLA